MKHLLKTKRELLLNKSSNILCITGLPNTRKTFLSILFSPAEPVVYVDFSFKNVANLADVFKSFHLDVFQVPPEELQSADRIVSVISELARGTLVLDSVGMLPTEVLGNVTEAILSHGKSVSFNIIVNAFTAWTRDRKSYLSISLPSLLLPLDRRLIDMLFVSQQELTMLGRSEVRWSI